MPKNVPICACPTFDRCVQAAQAVAQAHNARTYYFSFNLYANVQHAKRDQVTADIYYYITTGFGYAKRGLRLTAYGGVVLQRFEIIRVSVGKNGNRHYS